MGKQNRDRLHGFTAPSWASFFTNSQYVDFTRHITDELKQRGLSWKDDDGCAVIRRGGGPAQRVGLLNLAQMCHRDPAPKWPQVIHDFFENTLKVEQQIQHMFQGMQDLGAVRSKVKLRIHGESYLQTPGAGELLIRKVTDGLVQLAVCDLGMANISVHKTMCEGWGLSEDEVFALGLANVRAQEKAHHMRMPPLPNGVVLEGIEDQSNYTATHALCLEDHCKGVSSFGMILTIPNRHMIFMHRITDMNHTEAISPLYGMTEQAYRDGPGQISKDVFWWRPGKGLRRLMVQKLDDKLHFMADPEYQQEVFLPLMRGN
jgi:hypothetical protein